MAVCNTTEILENVKKCSVPFDESSKVVHPGCHFCRHRKSGA